MNHTVVFKTLLKAALQDWISIGWAVIFPMALIVGMRVAFGDALDATRLLAGTVGFATIFFAVHGTGFDILGQRTRGVYKLLRASPFPVSVFIVWLSLARGVITVAAALAVALFGNWWLAAGLSPDDLLGLIAGAVLGALAFTTLGVIMGNLGNNEGQVAALNNIVTFPLLFLTETFYSLGEAPAWLQMLRDVLPFNHYLRLVQTLATGDLAAAWGPMLIVAGFGLAFLSIAVLTFRWDPAQPLLRTTQRRGPRRLATP